MESKRLKLLLVVFLLLLLSGCETYIQSEHGTIAVSGKNEASVSYNIAEQIYSTSTSGDIAGIKKLFSQYAVNNNLHSDKQLNKFVSMLNRFKSYDGVVVTEISNSHGSRDDIFNIELNFYDNSDKVLKLSICYYFRSDSDQTKTGIYSISCLKEPSSEPGFLFEDTPPEPGIYFL